MSYDIGIYVDTGGPEPLHVEPYIEGFDPGEHYSGHFNYTYNVAPMFHHALGKSLSDLSGVRCGDLVDTLRGGVVEMTQEPETYRAMDPANGWGCYEGALGYLRHVLAICEAHPDAKLAIT